MLTSAEGETLMLKVLLPLMTGIVTHEVCWHTHETLNVITKPTRGPQHPEIVAVLSVKWAHR